MVKKVLALCDGEKDYLRYMADFLEKKELLPFSVHAFTDVAQLSRFTLKHEVELLLIAESAYEKAQGECLAAHVLILNESGNQVGEDTENINKYQSSENIFRAVMNWYTAGEKTVPRRIAAGGRMKLIGNYTPVGRCLQTTFALSMGQILAKKHKTLYLNFESCSGLSYMLEKESAADITDVLYYFNCEREKLAYRLDGMVQRLNGLYYIPPVFSWRDLREVTGEQWLQLFEEIERASEYEYLILDLSEQLQGLFDILRECFRIFTIVKEDGMAEGKLRQYEALLKAMSYEDIAGKTKKWKLPVFHRIPSGLDQLTHGDLAAYVQTIVEEDIYGYKG